MKNILVCGGAGYIGAHMAKWLAAAGHKPTVFDNLSTGHRESVRWGEFIQGDMLDADALRRAFQGRRFDAVMHFCAFSLVGDSVKDPQAYYRNNVGGSLNLLGAMREAGVDKLVFSSTAAVYGMPEKSPIDESQPVQPINPYGWSKMMVERMLMDAAAAYGLRSMSLRYFNAAGADPSGEIGESHHPETHLIPNILKAALEGGTVDIFGDDYPTPDGTCVRDYVHINDLAAGHMLALEHMDKRPGAHRYNLGSDSGFSVKQVVEAARRITGKSIATKIGPRRAGDPPTLVASSAAVRRDLGWKPAYPGVESIIETAWRWHQAPRY
ncbi:MAG TPA: UDP-glucose 4-epimerase GalE [Gammaproteobacteria bacterium]|nr:UDP-glucose 4-epimerase GalE [Gammaproteobacteria bacterium]